MVLYGGQFAGILFGITGLVITSPTHNGAESQNNNQHNSDETDRKSLQLFSFSLFLSLPFGHFGSFQLLAELLLTGCAHVIKSSQFSNGNVLPPKVWMHRLSYYN